MYPHQTERLTGAIEGAGLAALVATSPANVAYITGFRSVTENGFRSSPLAVFTRHGTALVVPAVEAVGVVADAIDVDHVVCFGEGGLAFAEPAGPEVRRIQAIVDASAASPAEGLAIAIERLDVRQGSIGVDESRLAHEGWLALTRRLADLKPIVAADHLADARRVKGPWEIECLAHALRIAEEALDVVIQTIDRGMTEREAATLYAAEVVKHGAWPVPALVAMGQRTAIPASWPTDRALARGDLVRLDVACVYKGYCSSVARTAVLGPPTSRQETACAAVQAGLEAAIAAVTAGRVAGRVAEAAVEAVRAHGIPSYQRTEVGHGIGLEPDERPRLTTGGEIPLEMGEVLRIETPYHEIGLMGVSARDTVLVTSAGARVLNRSHHGLIVLD